MPRWLPAPGKWSRVAGHQCDMTGVLQVTRVGTPAQTPRVRLTMTASDSRRSVDTHNHTVVDTVNENVRIQEFSGYEKTRVKTTLNHNFHIPVTQFH